MRGMLPEENLEVIQGIPILAENVKYHDVDSYRKLLDVMNSL